MANASLFYRKNPHFFQPLLPGFQNHLTIPVKFFSDHITGKHEGKTVTLRSDASEKTWKVKMEEQRLTQGWKEFVESHDLRIGDIIVFKHEGDLLFKVTPLGPSCCEIQYRKQSHIIEEEEEDDSDDDDDDALRKTEPESSMSFDYCFVAKVTTSNLKFDALHLPMKASKSNALNRGLHEMIVVNKEGQSWTLNLRFRESSGNYYITGGWRSFCNENRQRIGDLIKFNLVGDGNSTPIICVCSKEECSDVMSKYKNTNKNTERRRIWVASSSSKKNRFVTISLTSYNMKNSKLILPLNFVKINGINKHKNIILMDKHGVKRLTKLVQDGPNYGRRGLGKGWKIFCEANDVFKIGVPFVLELIWEDSIPVLKFFSKVKIDQFVSEYCQTKFCFLFLSV